MFPWCAIASKENTNSPDLFGLTQKLPFFHENRADAFLLARLDFSASLI